MNLTNKIRNKNHVISDNFYITRNLHLDLQQQGIHSNGTMRADCKGFQAKLKSI